MSANLFVPISRTPLVWVRTFWLRELFLVVVALVTVVAGPLEAGRFTFAIAVFTLVIPYDIVLRLLTRRRGSVPPAMAFGDVLIAALFTALFPEILPAALVAATASLGLSAVAFPRRTSIRAGLVAVAGFAGAMLWWVLEGTAIPTSAVIGIPAFAVAIGVLIFIVGTLARREDEAMAWLGELVDGLDVLVWEYDFAEQRVTYMNERTTRMFGLPPQAWYEDAELWDRLVHPDDRRMVLDRRRAAYRQATAYDVEYRGVTARGETAWVREIVAVTPGPDGRGARIRGCTIDVTEWHRTNEVLARRQRRESTLGALTREALSEPDPEALIERIVAVTAELFEAEVAAWLRAPSGSMRRTAVAGWQRGETPPSPAPDVLVAEISGRDHPWGLIAVAGRAFDADERHFLQAIANLAGIAATRADAEGRLRQAQKMEAVGQLAGGMAHDFNNLLTAVLGHAELLEKLAVTEDMRRSVREIQEVVERAAGLAAQLLAFGRGQPPETRAVVMNEVVSGMRSLLETLTRDQIDLRWELADDVGAVRGSVHELEQVLVNLVANARDAMPRGGAVTVRTRTRDVPPEVADCQGLAPGPHVELSVEDTGEGMSPEVREQAFEPFFTTKPVGTGTGLGLPTVAAIVRNAGGAISLDSRLGAGTRVEVLLPQLPEDLVDAPVLAPVPAGRRTVLVIEDQATIRSLLREVLEQAGYEVRAAQHGTEALARAEAGDSMPDLVMTDVMLPDMGGREAAQRLRAIWPGVKIVLMSAFPGREHAGEADGYLHKPFGVAALLRCVAEVLEGGFEQRG